MSQELAEDPWSEEEHAAADSFMEDAAKLLHEYLGSSDLQVWCGKQKYFPELRAADTIIVSQSATDWGENRPSEGFLLWIRQSVMIVNFDVKIGQEIFSSMTPFGGGHSPIKIVENLANKLAHLDLSIHGSQLMELLDKQLLNLCNGTSVHSEVCESGGQTLYRCDVHNCLADENWFCVAFLLNEAGQVGIWTRDDFDRVAKFHEVDFKHDFADGEQTRWIDDVLLSETVLDELTR